MLFSINHRRKSQKVISLLCILGMLVASLPNPITQVSAQGGDEPERTRSNHDTQVKVLGPSNVRINTWNGNLFYPVPVLTIPGQGLSIELYMSYNSSWHDFATHYSYGWQLSYNMFYVRDENGDIIVVREDGRSDRFINDNGSFLSPVDIYDTLQEYQPGKYMLRTEHGMEFYFDSPIHKRLTRMQDPNGNALTFAYDSDMLLTTITDASGRQVNFTYTGGNLTTITDPNTAPSRSIQFQYDANDDLVSIVNPLGDATDYIYDTEHYLTSIAPPRGVSTTITYSNSAVTNVTGELTSRSLSYDTENRITTMTDSAPEGDQITRFYYDVDGRIASIEDSLGNSISMAWDDSNNLTSLTDQNDKTTKYTYDVMGNLLSVTDALSNATRYTYGGTYNKLASVTNTNGYTTTYEYDSSGNLVSGADPLDHTTVYTYNSVGDLISRTDANGATTDYDYDDHGNLTTVTDPLGGIVSYSYDAVGNMTGMTNTHVSVLYTYDTLNRVINVDYASHGKSISYTYDAAGNRTSMTDPDGRVTIYTYDDANRPVSLTNPLSQTSNYTYDSRGRLIRQDYGNGTYATYQYDQANRLLSLVNRGSSGEVISSYTYEYDAAGNRTKMTEANGDETTYGYDDLYQLTSVTYPDGSTVEYAYDAVGNRLVLTDTTGTTNYSYDDADRLLSAGMTTYGWDNNGNLITRIVEISTTTYAYDSENRLISITFPDSSANAFTYYPDGKRLTKTDTSGETTYYFYDGPNVIVEANSAGTTIARYTSGLRIDDWISMDRGGSSYFYHHDGLGSVTGLTNLSGAVVATYKYDVFGAIKSQIGSVVNPYRFTGREYDEESGLYYYRARYYDAGVGRFITKDSFTGQVHNPLSINKYLYVQNNPTIFIDPHGTSLWPHIIVHIIIIIIEWVWPEPLNEGEDEFFDHDGGDNTGNAPGDGGGTGPGSGSEIESKPLNVVPSAFLDDGGWDSAPVSSPKPQSQPLVTLEDILPTTGPPGTTPTVYTPTLALAITDVVSARAVDFIHGETGLTKGVVMGIETQNTVYEHDHAVCGRFHDYTVETIVPMLIPGPAGEQAWYWYASAHKDDLLEEAFTFAVFVDESAQRFTVDSRWRWDDFQSAPLPDHDYILNFQIWAPSAEDAYDLVRQTLTNLAAFDGGSWVLDFTNTTQPTAPSVIIRKGTQIGSDAHLTLRSWFTETAGIPLTGSWRAYTDRTTNIPLSQTVSITPGVNHVVLSLPNLLDAVVYTNDGHFGDKVYVGSGFWFVFDDEGEPWPQSQVTKIDLDCTGSTGLGANVLIIPGCAGMTGTITQTSGYAGLGVTINPNGMPIDVSEYAALTFRARGDGRSCHLKLETASVQDSDFHEIVFTAPTEWRQFVIPFSTFRQRRENTPVPLTGTDVKALIWAAEGPLPDPSVHLEIDHVAFFDSVVISDTTGPTSTNDVFGPYTVTAHILDDVSIESAILYYRLNGGNTFTPVPMTLASGNVYADQIPGQPMGTEVSYYVEATDGNGNVATNPPDAPFMTHHFRVEWNPSLLVDDFFDVGSTNLLGGDSGITQDGGTATASYGDGALCLTYNITGTGGYAVYYSLLKKLDVTPYRSLSLQIKGASGGEKAKIGLNDGHGHEPKLEISEHLPNGITTDWQTVNTPLTAFTRVITDWSQLHSFSLAFEEGIGSGQGTVCIDDIRFKPDALPIPLDNFNDLDCQNGVGQQHDSDVGGGASMVVGYDQTNPYGGAGASLALTYTVPGDAYAAWHSGLGGLDVSSYDKLTFVVRGASGGENFHVWLVDQEGGNGWVDVISYTTVANAWPSRPVEIPLQDFAAKGVDLTQLSLFKVAFEWVPMSGAVYLDDIRFTLPPSPTITALSPIAATNDVSTTLALTGTNFLMTPTVALGYNLLKNVTLLSSTTLTATIPPGIAAGVYDVRVIQPNMQSGVMNSAFTINDFYSLTVVPTKDAKSGDPGTTVTYTLRMTNTGNATDVYTVTVSDNVWTTTAPETAGPLVAGNSTNVTIAVTIPVDAAGGAVDTATIIVTSLGDNTQSATSTLTTTANNTYGLIVTPLTDTRSGDPGTTVTYTLQMANTGNATDTFGVAVGGNVWITTADPTTVGPLGAEASANVLVTVNIPTGIAEDTSDTATITVTSQGLDTVSATTRLTTRASPYRAFLPIILRNTR